MAAALQQALGAMWLAAQVLRGGRHLGAQLAGGLPGPARVVEHGAGHADGIGLAGIQDGLGLLRVGDQAHGNHGHGPL